MKFFGFTGLGDVEAIEALVDSGEFDSFQAYYNLLNPSAGQAVPAGFSALDYGRVIDRAAACGMGVVVIRVLAAGVLSPTPESGGGTSREPLSAGSDYERDVARAYKLGFLKDHGLESLPRAAIRFALMKPEVSTVLVGLLQQRPDRRSRGLLRRRPPAGCGHGRTAGDLGQGLRRLVARFAGSNPPAHDCPLSGPGRFAARVPAPPLWGTAR